MCSVRSAIGGRRGQERDCVRTKESQRVGAKDWLRLEVQQVSANEVTRVLR